MVKCGVGGSKAGGLGEVQKNTPKDGLDDSRRVRGKVQQRLLCICSATLRSPEHQPSILALSCVKLSLNSLDARRAQVRGSSCAHFATTTHPLSLLPAVFALTAVAYKLPLPLYPMSITHTDHLSRICPRLANILSSQAPAASKI